VNARHEVTGLGVDPEILLRFFVTFARFEYALKAAGFFRARPVRRSRAAEYADAGPDWRRFTESIRNAFRSDACANLLSACHYLFENPPYREVIAAGNLVWETRPLRDDRKWTARCAISGGCETTSSTVASSALLTEALVGTPP
jgi:hypothetical protein